MKNKRATMIGLSAVVLLMAGTLARGHDVVPHTRLIASEPEKDDTLYAAPDRIRLVFSGPVKANASRIVVTRGGVESTLDVTGDPESQSALIAAMPSIASGGTHTVRWETVSADGHPVSGSYAFVVILPEPATAEPAGIEPAPAAPSDEQQATIEAEGIVTAESGSVSAVLQGLGMGAILAVAGLCLFLGWLAPDSGRRPARVVLGLAAVAPLLLLADAAVWVSSVPGGLGSALGLGVGKARLALIFAATLALAALAIGGRFRAAAALAFAAIAASALIGHSAAFSPAWSVPTKFIHLAAAAIWLGGLLLLVTDEAEGGTYAVHAGRISSSALAAVIAIVITGVVQMLVIVPQLGLLTSSTYGGTLIIKIAGLVILIGFGAYHRFRLLPALSLEGGRRLRSSVRWEVLVMMVVILVAAFLASTTPPELELADDGATERQLVER